MKKNLQDAIIFLGNSIRFFAVQMLLNFMVLALMMIFTLTAFHLHVKYFHSIQLFLFVVAGGFSASLLLQVKILRKKYITMQQAFVSHRLKGRASWQLITPDIGFKQHFKHSMSMMKSLDAGIFARGLGRIYGVIQVTAKVKSAPSKDQVLESRSWYIRSFAWRILMFLILLLPFAVVSFLLTIGIVLELRLVISIIGLWFVWFLYMAICSPIFQLLMVDKIYDQYVVGE